MGDDKPKPGTIGWRDITVPDAKPLADFYAQVIGWEIEDTDMGDYDDYTMKVPGTGAHAAGICHARGMNANIPPQWMIYITVENLDASVQKCTDLGGEIIEAPRSLANGRWSVIKDPVGAVVALYEEKE